MLRGQIVHRRIVERLRITDHTQLRVAHRLQPVQPRAGVFLGAAVVDDQHLVVLVGGLFDQRVDAAQQQAELVFGRDDDRDARRGPVPVVNAVAAWQRGLDAGLFVATMAQMAKDRLLLGRLAGNLLLWRYQQRLVDMAEAFDAAGIDQAQQQVEFGRIGTSRVETARIEEGFAPEQPMPRHARRHRQQQVKVEVRTQQRGQVALVVTHQFVGRQCTQAGCI
jgi:hypothetical protein